MSSGRLFEILYLLVERRSVTAGELARRFEVSQRTIYRDIDALSAAGIPVYAEKGRNGGIRLMEQYVLDRALLSQREQDEVLFALKSLTSALGMEGDGALRRLSALFRRSGDDWLEVDFSNWGEGEAEQVRFATMKEAILARRVLEFTYYSSTGECTSRQVEPEKMLLKGGNWYLKGHCRLRHERRLFRLSRMESVSLGETISGRRSEEDVQPSSGTAAAPEPHYTPLCLRFSSKAAYRVYDFFSPKSIQREGDGTLLVCAVLPVDEWVEGFLLSFGGQLKVCSPPWLRERIKEECEIMLGQYK